MAESVGKSVAAIDEKKKLLGANGPPEQSKSSSSLFELSDTESDLEMTIDRYLLNKLSNNVTVRAPSGPSGSNLSPPSTAIALTAVVRQESFQEDGDADVTDLQCLLAEALLSNDQDDPS